MMQTKLIEFAKRNLRKIGLLRRVVSWSRNILRINKNGYRDLRLRLEKNDALHARENPGLIPLHKRLNEIKDLQKSNWHSFVYCDGYFYQGFERIGICGIKPTEKRIENYEIRKLFDESKDVLDIGSNCGFLACYLADYFRKVDGIEINPYLIEMAEETKNYLNLGNVSFINADFASHEFDPHSYDVVFSLSNHHTIDGNLNEEFRILIKKIFDVLRKDGILFFESHNVNGDDKDLDQKFRIASEYFNLVDYKMVPAFYKPDIDKLFAVFRKRGNAGAAQLTGFNLEEAKKRYHYNAGF